jgi:hypothetical protein
MFPDPASCGDSLGAFGIDPGSLFAGPCVTDADLGAGGSVVSFPFPLETLDSFALSSFICTSVFSFGPSAFARGFFSLGSLDVTPRFVSGFEEPLGVALGVFALDELALAGVCAGVVVVL